MSLMSARAMTSRWGGGVWALEVGQPDAAAPASLPRPGTIGLMVAVEILRVARIDITQVLEAALFLSGGTQVVTAAPT